MPPRRVGRPRVDEERRHEDGREYEERERPPPPPLDMNAQMLAGMTQFFAQFAGNNAMGARQPGPEAVYERFMKMRPKEFKIQNKIKRKFDYLKIFKIYYRIE